MPMGRYPDRVGPFRKWANDKVTKADINDRATSSRRGLRRIRRKRRKRLKD